MKGFFKSFVFAANGILVALKTEQNFKVQLVIGLFVIIASVYLQITKLDWCVILLAIGLVLGLELINSAVENLVNLVMPEKNTVAGRVKDFAAGAVLMGTIAAAIVGVLVFWPYLISAFNV